MVSKRFHVLAFLMVTVFVVSACTVVPADEPVIQQTTTFVETHSSQGDVVRIEGSIGTLFTTDDSVTMAVSTSGLIPGHIYTAWWVIANNPEA